MTKPNKVARPRSGWQRAILDALDDGRPATLGDIFERIGVRMTPADREAAGRALDRLEAEGLIEYRIPALAKQGDLWRVRLRRR